MNIYNSRDLTIDELQNLLHQDKRFYLVDDKDETFSSEVEEPATIERSSLHDDFKVLKTLLDTGR